MEDLCVIERNNERTENRKVGWVSVKIKGRTKFKTQWLPQFLSVSYVSSLALHRCSLHISWPQVEHLTLSLLSDTNMWNAERFVPHQGTRYSSDHYWHDHESLWNHLRFVSFMFPFCQACMTSQCCIFPNLGRRSECEHKTHTQAKQSNSWVSMETLDLFLPL